MVGMMGAGKTAVGTALARLLGVPFRDTDAAIQEAADRSIAEIFARDGEVFFRRKEGQVLERLLSERPGILSTGGGAFLAERNRSLISCRGCSVWLKVDLPLLWARVRHKNTRPLLQTADPQATLRELHDKRVPAYEQADLTVPVGPNSSIEDTAHLVVEALLDRPDVLVKR
jgi:shikimate kinase